MLLASLALITTVSLSSPFDAAPFGTSIEHGAGVQWEDPRELHKVVVTFKDRAPDPRSLRLEYWSSRWPELRLPKDRQPGGGDVGWWELGNWYTGEWRKADTEAALESGRVVFTFNPVNRQEFPRLTGFDARYRYTLKIRVASDSPLGPIVSISALTDSTVADRAARIAWSERIPSRTAVSVFNGRHIATKQAGAAQVVRLTATENSDPNTFDRTLVTIRAGKRSFTFAPDDLARGPILVPHVGAVILPVNDHRTYEQVRAAQHKPGITLYDRVAALPEQTWRKSWAAMPPKKSRIYFPLGLNGGRQRFQLNGDGSVLFRTNDNYLKARPGRDTPRLLLERGPVRFRFGLPDKPVDRSLEQGVLPICRTRWEQDGVSIAQTAFVTPLGGTDSGGGAPPADSTTVLMLEMAVSNSSDAEKTGTISLKREPEDDRAALRVDAQGRIWGGQNLRGEAAVTGHPVFEPGRLSWSWTLAPGETRLLTLKLPYVVLTAAEERAALAGLDFNREKGAVAAYWGRQLDRSARLITPEPLLNEFYRSHAMHLLVNCEREPGSDRRFARVGSFGYGAYGNESCMMVADLDRRGYHDEARECLDAWLRYQSTVALPGDFDSKEGVLYGAGGYEAGGYNQHHGWILWCMAEHYRFTRDNAWLHRAAPGIVAATEWIARERARTRHRPDLSRGLLPAGSLEDIQDWWPWLSTNCYTWRALDSAAWALEKAHHPEAARIRNAADDYHRSLLAAFREASLRAPVVRLRDGTSVPHIPSHVFRRGRTFGWICETLEGALHLLITRAIDAKSPEAEAILKDYEDNLFLSNQYGYTIPDFEKNWFQLGGMSMQACLLLDVEPYLFRDDVKQALRAMFNAISVGYFPDVQMLTEHSLPNPGDWRGDHFKSSDEANAAGWLRQIFVREDGDTLLLGQAIPREWLGSGKRCGLQRAATYFGPMSVVWTGGKDRITARLDAPERNPPNTIRLRFRGPVGRLPSRVTVNGKPWKRLDGDWVVLPGSIGHAEVVAEYPPSRR